MRSRLRDPGAIKGGPVQSGRESVVAASAVVKPSRPSRTRTTRSTDCLGSCKIASDFVVNARVADRRCCCCCCEIRRCERNSKRVDRSRSNYGRRRRTIRVAPKRCNFIVYDRRRATQRATNAITCAADCTETRARCQQTFCRR